MQKVLEVTDFKKLEENVSQLIKRFFASECAYIKAETAIFIPIALSKSSKIY